MTNSNTSTFLTVIVCKYFGSCFRWVIYEGADTAAVVEDFYSTVESNPTMTSKHNFRSGLDDYR
ncbi:hypothetical protein TcasGA2_TC003285 [Tribolium castaneum]|uniref:Uncharacterized protein n=1 Tax=Tribolium castaneum TaxID=7070 RepID=D6WEL4_TRICA|nr:hypothetical protein TcasGA2_TC003285 [Tribolium castaneum]